MHFRPILSINLKPYFPAALATRANEFNGRLEPIESRRAGFIGKLFCQEPSGPADSLLTEELAVRREWEEIDAAGTTALKAAVDDAESKIEQARAKVANGLESIGYLPHDGRPRPGAWLPGFIAAHPSIRELKEPMEEHTHGNIHQSRQNANCIEQLEIELARRSLDRPTN